MKLSESHSRGLLASGALAVLAVELVLLSGCMMKRPGMVTGLPRAGVLSTGVASPSEELWVLARGSAPALEMQEDVPGSGTLMAKVDEKQVPMPLKHTDVRASVSGYLGSVEVIQQFHNPYSSKIEAVYVFPLPDNAAVNEFIMTLGERRIRGIIREREDAEKIYQEAKRQGYVASLLTEERRNAVATEVSSLPPRRGDCQGVPVAAGCQRV